MACTGFGYDYDDALLRIGALCASRQSGGDRGLPAVSPRLSAGLGVDGALSLLHLRDRSTLVLSIRLLLLPDRLFVSPFGSLPGASAAISQARMVVVNQ